MSYLILFLAIVAGGLVLALVLALFVRKGFTVERFIDIERPKKEVFDFIKLLKNQNRYGKWATMDSGMKKEYLGTDGKVGFVSIWESSHKDVGKGEQEIVGITEGARIDFELRFLKPFRSTSPAHMTTQALSQRRTRVSWGLSGKMNYPMNLMFLFINVEKRVARDLDIGLGNLKKLLE